MTDRGHRSLPHTADARLEAWGPTRETCFAEAVAALAELYVDPPDVPRTEPVPVTVPPADPADQFVRLLDEALYLLDVEGRVALTAHLTEADGALAGTLATVSLADAPQTGSAPKAVTRHDLRVERLDGSWRCRVTVDV